MARRTRGLNRRSAVAGAAAVGVGVPLLAACGADEPTGAADTPATTDSSTPASSPSDAASSSDAASPSEGGGGGGLSTADVPVGGGVIVADQKVVVTQPTEGDFKAFSAACTHAGCLVTSVTDTINCKCHGSAFSITDGSVVKPPATKPLPAAALTVDGDTITLG